MAPPQEKQTQGRRADEETSPLLELPPELRNKIYRYALVSGSTVYVGLGGFVEPSLLATCKHIRQEASPIFYKENEIEVLVDSYNITNCFRWERKIEAVRNRGELHGKASYSGSVITSSTRYWENLLAWMEAYHNGSMRQSAVRPSRVALTPTHLEDMVLGGMFLMVAGMENKPWTYVKKVVQEQRLILAEIHAGWSK